MKLRGEFPLPVVRFFPISLCHSLISYNAHHSTLLSFLFICPLNAKFTYFFRIFPSTRLAYPHFYSRSHPNLDLSFSDLCVFLYVMYACSFQFTVMDHHHIHMYNHLQMVLISRMDENGVRNPVAVCLRA